ncbi:hypothetical protein [Geoglobus acetivorans]|uniref:Uncharacterized protein n=1 Tax=Geoglobus acetivorans TaxID=565033 RepID=A0ABZ3H164_GEOAI|nr:hypothetical protein [Geoglobus acetivorans]
MEAVVEEFRPEGFEEVKAKPVYRKSGYVQANVGDIIALIVGIGVATLVLIFVGTLGGQTYVMVEPEINSINNTQVQTYVNDAIINSFKALAQTGKYLPVVVMAVIIFIVLGLVMGLGRAGYGYYYGGAL